MKDDNKTKTQLVHELSELRSQNAGLEKTRKELAVIKMAADEVSEFAESIINTVREPLIALDQDLRVVTASRSFYNFFRVKPEETVGQLIYDLGNKQWDIPKLRELLETILPQQTTFDNYEVEHDFIALGTRIMLLNARQIQRALRKDKVILLAIEDITEQKRLENLLTESEERYRNVFETASDGIVLFEKSEGKITHANQSAEKMLGYSLEESVGKKLHDIGIVDIDDFQTLMQILNEIGITHYTDVQIKTKSGQHIDTDIYLADRASLVQCNIRDITERKLAEEVLKKTSKRLDLAQVVAKTGIWDWDIVTGHIEWTDQMFDLFGLDQTKAKASFEAWRGVLHPEDLEIAGLLIDRALKEKNKLDSDYRVILPDGQIRWINSVGSGEYDDQGQAIRMIGICIDITARKQVEAELIESEKCYRSLFENMIEGSAYCKMIFEDEKPVDFIYLDVNSAFESQTGLKNVIGRKVSEVIPGIRELNPELFERYARVVLTGHPERFEIFVKALQMWFAVSVYSPAHEYFVAMFDVITERKQAEERLRVSEYEFRNLAESMPQIVWITRPDGWNIYFNQQWMGYTGMTLEESYGHGWNKPFHPDDQQQAWNAWQNAIKHGAIYSLECRLRRADGIYTWWLIRGVPMKDSQGTILKWFGTCTDINGLKQAEKELSESEKRYKELFDNIKSGVAIYDVKDNGNDFIFKDFNKTGERLDEDRKENVVGKSIYQVRSGIKEFGLVDVFKRVWETGIPEHYPAKFYEDERLKKWFENYVYKLPTGEIVAVYDDITERKKIEESLRESEERYKGLFERSLESVYLCDFEGNFIDANDAALKLLGYTKKDIKSLNFSSLLTDDQISLAFETLEEILKTGSQEKLTELKLRRKNGEYVYVESVGAMIYREGKPYAIQGIARNITDRKQWEEKLVASQEQLRAFAERLQQIREEERTLISREIHDVMGGGLTGLKMDINWLIQNVNKAKSDKEQDAFMSRFLSTNDNIDYMIKATRIISTGLRPPVLDDLGLIAALEWQLSDLTSRSGIPYKLTTAFEYVGMEKSKATAVFRIFQETLTNVIRHSRATKVDVVLREDDERSLFGDENLVLEISDNGRGITEDEILNLKSLGLLGMKERAMVFGGEFSIRGEPGGGTTAVLKIPRKKGEAS